MIAAAESSAFAPPVLKPADGAHGKPISAASDNVVELSAVRFSWPRSETSPVIDIPSLQIARGERLFLRGASGSGKSTLLNLLAGVITPQQGTIRILGHDLKMLGAAGRDRFRADHVGYIFQMFNLIAYLSVIENVTLPCCFSALRQARATRRGGSVAAEALRLLHALDMGSDDLLARPVTKLSVGQQQRVAVARALIGSPELIIADEPTSALDEDRRTVFLDLLFRQCSRERTALVFASHDGSLARRFDRVIGLSGVGDA